MKNYKPQYPALGSSAGMTREESAKYKEKQAEEEKVEKKEAIE